jgi:transcription-repair coupling factor (superfamily II helicase)
LKVGNVLQNIIDEFLKNKDVQSIVEGVEAGFKEQLVTGHSGSSRSLLMSALFQNGRRPIMIVTNNLLQAQKVVDDLIALLPNEKIYLFPTNEMIAAELSVSSPELRAQRLTALNHFSTSEKGILVTSIAGLKKQLPPKSEWLKNQLIIKLGTEIDLQRLSIDLVAMGYSRSHMVSSPGEFSVRGGILDLYPLTEENPIRIELFDTEIDTIRSFSLETQRSIKNLSELSVGPATEFIVNEQQLSDLSEKIKVQLKNSLSKIKDQKIKENLIKNIDSDVERLSNGQKIEHLIRYFSFIYEESASLMDYFPKNGVVIFDEISRIQEINEQIDVDDSNYYLSLLESGEALHGLVFTHKYMDLVHHTKNPIIYLSLFLRGIPNASPQNIVNFSCKPMQSFHGQMSLLKTEIERWQKGKYTVLLQGSDESQVNKIERVLEDFNLIKSPIKNPPYLIKGEVQIVQGEMQTGFELPLQKLIVVTGHEIFYQKNRKRFKQQKISNAEKIRSYSELKRGDYVVHINHGIGKYIGIETLEINGVHKDFLHIRYAGTDKLYIPVDQIDAVQKYVGAEGKEPKIYKLGGTDWKKTKAKVQASVDDIADELIKLYAEREVSKGFAFSKDDDMQRDFELSFAYQETEDQLRSIEEIKRDMERERPMDRLLCGDVGYGKTEVALRAAFKAVRDDKQVAILVPTTILAQQHYETMRERFQDQPVNIALLNRFRTKKQHEETLKGLKTGTVDVVVGTHRILSKDVLFSDLGLLIVDEEQRFGVKHKERIKQLKTNVDVLTLTATPIPRTLHMSMMGVRDLSVIETPPENRFPIQTYVMEYNPNIVREAIEREMSRGGQVFFLHNRVEDISKTASEISAMVPDAKVAYAHGKMSENELESVLYSFLEGEFDVLVSTTIIETGIDIPNVNTLIIEDADKMGLSQLYQLRGRVGRSNRVAYAYFTYRKDKVLTEVADKRLQAIKEFTELGSGFKIAMRDLSIRGAGNLLGAEQHGFIESVGFDMYSRMLEDAIQERKGVVREEAPVPVEFEVDIDAYIPDKYILNSNQKIEMYKLFKSVSIEENVDDLKDELLDRFGDYPKEVELLLLISELKMYARQAGIEIIKQQQKNEIAIYMSDKSTKDIDGAKLFGLVQPYGRTVGLGQTNGRIKITLFTRNLNDESWLKIAIEIAKRIPDCQKVINNKQKTKI